MKLIPVVYKGFTAMDRRFSSPMLPWIVSEIRKRNCSEKLSLGVEEGVLQAYNQDFELHFGHRVSQMTRFSQADMDPCTFLYLLKNDNEQLLYCYLFQAKTVSDVTDLYKQMKEQNHLTPTRSLSSAANLTSLCVDISPSSSNFFEVLYIGKIKVWQKKIPENFIDEALNKFKAHELEKHSLRQLGNIGKLKSENSLLRRGSTDSTASDTIKEEPLKGPPVPPLLRSQSVHSSLLVQRQPSTDEESPHDPGSRAVIDDHNRTMVLQVDRTDLRLISPDRKVVLLQKRHRDVATCLQGQLNPEHFGFICSEGNNSNIHIGYVFKCESSSIANDAMAAITQAFLHAESRPRHSVSSCEHCPMVWFHKLCLEIENMSDRKTQAAILRRLDQLDEEDRSTILAKFRGAEPDSARDQNDFLMMLVRAHCEARQSRHVHDSPEQRSEFLSLHLGGAGGGATIFSKAKRSLSHSFDQLLKRKASRDDFGAALRGMGIPISNRESHSPSPSINNDMSDRESDGCRSRSSTVGSQNDLRDTHLGVRDAQNSSVSPEKGIANEKGPKSPMLDIFMKVGNSSKASAAGENGSPDRLDSGSWRQAIFKRVITPSKLENLDQSPRRRTKEELRILWKKSIYQAILLVRMEKENARIRAKQEESAVKRIKLEYDEMKPVQRELTEMWEMLTSKEGGGVKCDDQMLLQAIRQGVPRGKRGEVWTFLEERFCLKVPPFDAAKHPNYSVPYETLLKQLTAHQHAILIDLGRTFPNHSYFSSPLGPGQLALFNLLKAYSLLDPEVGYCQGLSFVTGILLLHMEETQAFNLLRHLMFRRGMRSQYLPDMVGLQIKLYQLSRLLHDQLPELYNHFDSYEVAPTLYAAPWLLTVFASQFPLGFVTRVFDLMFIEGPDVIFRVALALLSYHKEKLLICDSFEEIMNYLKIQLPTIDKSIMDKVMKEVFTTDFAKQLNEYKVEYHVLQEETTAVKPHVDALRQQELQNRLLVEQKRLLMAQLEATIANVNRLERTRSLQQTQLNRLEMQNRGLNVTIATLGRFIETLVERNVDVEIPGEVQGILAQLSISERRQRSVTKTRSAGNIDLPLDLQNHPTEKASKFFSDSHSDILRANSTPKIDVTASPTSSVDSGVATPVSPGCLDHHPLSHCDVSFTFNGTRELRSVKNVKSLKGYSADILSK